MCFICNKRVKVEFVCIVCLTKYNQSNRICRKCIKIIKTCPTCNGANQFQEIVHEDSECMNITIKILSGFLAVIGAGIVALMTKIIKI